MAAPTCSRSAPLRVHGQLQLRQQPQRRRTTSGDDAGDAVLRADGTDRRAVAVAIAVGREGRAVPTAADAAAYPCALGHHGGAMPVRPHASAARRDHRKRPHRLQLRRGLADLARRARYPRLPPRGLTLTRPHAPGAPPSSSTRFFFFSRRTILLKWEKKNLLPQSSITDKNARAQSPENFCTLETLLCTSPAEDENCNLPPPRFLLPTAHKVTRQRTQPLIRFGLVGVLKIIKNKAYVQTSLRTKFGQS